MENLIIGVILLVLVGAAVAYIVKAKKSGAKCIGCPADGNCAHKSNEEPTCGCGCGCHTDTK